MSRGRFISFEGGEGTGKSTQARRLADTLSARSLKTVLTREPGGTPLGEAIRGLILADRPAVPASELLLFAAARIEHLAQVIRPALARGAWVVCDRYIDSTRVYQGILAHVDPRLISSIEQLTLAPGDMPDLTLVLDLDPEVGRARAQERGSLNRFDRNDIEAQRTIRAGFLAVAAADPARCAVIDAAAPIDTIAANILAEVERRLPRTSA
jgi:dTMP kinase